MNFSFVFFSQRNYGQLVQQVIVKVMKKFMLEVHILFGHILFEIFNVHPIWNLLLILYQKKYNKKKRPRTGFKYTFIFIYLAFMDQI